MFAGNVLLKIDSNGPLILTFGQKLRVKTQYAIIQSLLKSTLMVLETKIRTLNDPIEGLLDEILKMFPGFFFLAKARVKRASDLNK